MSKDYFEQLVERNTRQLVAPKQVVTWHGHAVLPGPVQANSKFRRAPELHFSNNQKAEIEHAKSVLEARMHSVHQAEDFLTLRGPMTASEIKGQVRKMRDKLRAQKKTVEQA